MVGLIPLWIPITILAAAALLVRNSLQAGLTREIGTLGATMVRFVYGVPFVVLFYGVALWLSGSVMPGWDGAFLRPAALGAFAQIGGTALMLKAMDMRGFAVANAYIKMEPVLLALGGWWILGDVLAPLAWLGIGVATLGVLIAAIQPARVLAALRGDISAIAMGLAAAVLFGVSALSFRAGILSLGPDYSAIIRALHMLLATILIQASTMVLWLGWRDPAALRGSFVRWRQSTGAGLAGALSSLGWFTGFALTAAANVRTLALVELPLAALVNRRLTGKAPTLRELAGIALVMVGIGLLLRATLA